MEERKCYIYLQEVGVWGPLGAPPLLRLLLGQLVSNKLEVNSTQRNKNTSNEDMRRLIKASRVTMDNTV